MEHHTHCSNAALWLISALTTQLCAKVQAEVVYGGLLDPPHFCGWDICWRDLDHDGIPDLLGEMGGDCPAGCAANFIADGVAVAEFFVVAELAWGDVIGPKLTWNGSGTVAVWGIKGCEYGPWCDWDATTSFVGVRFLQEEAVHYAWIRKTANEKLQYAYETKPNEPILAGAGYSCLADPNCDGVVDVLDLMAVVNSWGPCPAPPNSGDCPADIAPPPHGDGVVNVNDLLAVINNWSS